MNPQIKRYLVSSLVTFASVFLITLGASVSSLEATPAITGSAVVALLLVAVRAAIKASIEAVVGALKSQDEAQG